MVFRTAIVAAANTAAIAAANVATIIFATADTTTAELSAAAGVSVNVNAIFWFAALVLLCIIEGMTYSLICIWFAGGSVAAIIASLFGLNTVVQSTVFVIVSALLLILIRPIAVRITASKKTRTNADRVIGQEGIVIKKIEPISGEGQIKVIGQIWSAKPEDGKTIIDVDSRVEVMSITGVKVIVRPISRN